MADAKITQNSDAPKKKRAPQGPRKPQPIYVFGTVQDGKFVVSNVTKNARDIAKWASEGGLASGVQLITIELPSEGDKGTATNGEAGPEVGTGE